MVRLLSSVVALAVLLGGVSSAEAAKAKKNKPVKGAVVKVDKDSITVKTAARKKGAVPGQEVTYKLTGDTKVEKVSGKKGNQQTAPAKAGDLAAGQNVVLTLSGQDVKEVKILGGKKKKNKS
jgi:hypothetical protein